ncbi:MAG: protein kinase [Planctomycetaceae bacterium]|nr:protein kinase [Planctomycetaceae bacterium]
MLTLTTEDVAAAVVELGLIEAAEIAGVWRELGSQEVSPEQFGSACVRRELLTGYQWERLRNGYRNGFFYGRTKVLYQAGAGSFARVYRAIAQDTEDILAVKVLRKRFSSDEAKCELFLREGRMGLMLRHPGIVRIEEVGKEGSSSFITMEFVEGQTLRELVKIRKGIDIVRGIDLASQLIDALEYAHSEGVTHRDLKASNVLVSAKGRAKLVDFGLASFAESIGKKKDELGKLRTVEYAALEVAGGVRGDNVRSDVFFLGTLLYLLLAGRSAFKDSRDRAVRADPKRYADLEPLGKVAPHLPRDLVDLVNKMLTLKPKHRFQTVSEVKEALEPIKIRYADDDEIVSPEVSKPAREVSENTKPKSKISDKPRIMVVEVSGKSQDSLRQFFSKQGFRVLVTENPKRALSRFETIPPPADILLLSSQVLGHDAVSVFNALAPDPYLKKIPALLITSARQAELVSEAVEDDLRQVVTMPFKASDLLQRVKILTGINV